MWENVPDFLELFRNFPVSISVLFVVPVVLLSGPSSTVMAAHEFPVFRMQQYDLHQTQVGKSTSVCIVKQRTRSWMVYFLAKKGPDGKTLVPLLQRILQRCFVCKKLKLKYYFQRFSLITRNFLEFLWISQDFFFYLRFPVKQTNPFQEGTNELVIVIWYWLS